MESWEETPGVVFLIKEPLVLLIPRLGQILLQVSLAHFQGWNFPGHSEYLCQCWTTFGREELNFF